MRIDGKVALITGSSRGIGAATAVKLASEGADIIINYPFEAEKEHADKVVDKVNSLGRKAISIMADVSNIEQVKTMIKTAIKEFSKIDILVNNAGITRDNLIMRMKEKDWDAVMNVNLKGVFNCTKSVIRPMMKQKSGKIINLASVVGIMGNPGQANYSASKAGVIGFTKTIAKEVAARGITSNAVAPGFIKSHMTENLSKEVQDNMLAAIPLKKFGSQEDVANIICFLASSAADYINGQVINVDGGMVM
ncbi:3-oxoacyl-[acyl-carrier-protein] reductase [Iocasia frigidifontis]|uniref:3-oxoacyl-[acyl-carrier-protein] reductase n=1 Tax=Iocasia fonsfrigidae TaxID=2682810 RepID=A0A8A7KEW4_9FIRM|nr:MULTISPECIES: 3-oxoacyl-[acyl-carrier-protein] reductase [Halanaerobiaceae]AZO95338.1 3-oxoacyl-[acyl-carrier-protein] reductase [Halocella sp. SP3-1]QTL98218.1 3-oxoacyl-[acyl-carrier-protein] reductase [Iocasia fonsfrigidae]